jgi:hypothetical protein
MGNQRYLGRRKAAAVETTSGARTPVSIFIVVGGIAFEQNNITAACLVVGGGNSGA